MKNSVFLLFPGNKLLKSDHHWQVQQLKSGYAPPDVVSWNNKANIGFLFVPGLFPNTVTVQL